MVSIPNAPRILVVDEEKPVAQALAAILRQNGFEAMECASAEEALTAMEHSRFDLLLADLQILRAGIEKDPLLVGIIISDDGDERSECKPDRAQPSREAPAPAFDRIQQPFELSAILPVLNRAMTVRRLKLEKAALSEEFEQAARDLETFSYAVSHDLRTPLRAVRMFSSIITQRHGDECSEEVKRLFGFVQRGAQQMDQLIDDLVRLTRVGRQPLSKQPIDLTALVRSVIQELLKDQGENRPDLRVQELPQAVGDGPLLHELYTNLLSNALKFTQGKHPAIIEVGSNHDNGECTYFVRDNGSGFDMKHAAHLFGVFCRLHAKDEFEGNGIGLAIVQRIIKRHGGQVWAEAEPGRGATFYFRLE